jgi:hypothetical protein
MSLVHSLFQRIDRYEFRERDPTRALHEIFRRPVLSPDSACDGFDRRQDRDHRRQYCDVRYRSYQPDASHLADRAFQFQDSSSLRREAV